MSNFLVQGGAPPDDSVTTVKVQDDAINLAKMAGLARGTLIYGDASGDPAALAVGAANEVLTHDGTDFDWAAAAGGKIVQIVNVMDAAVSTTTTIFPNDDTTPQNDEGGEFMTLAITPTSSTNKLLIQVVGNGSPDGDSDYTSIALFQDTTAGALAAQNFNEHGGGVRNTFLVFNHFMTSGTTSSTTFKVRMGQHSSGTFTFNGSAGGRWFGGVMASSITITEISV